MRWVMALEDVLRLKSNDAEVYNEEHDYCLDGDTVADELTIDSIDDEYHQRIKRVMERERINLVPVLIVNDIVYNGHRRIMIAEELGLEEIICTDNEDDSGWWHTDEEIVIGETECEFQHMSLSIPVTAGPGGGTRTGTRSLRRPRWDGRRS